MSVLARDLESYQSAVDAYMRQMRGYNKSVDTYNQSLFTDANGQPYVRDAYGNVYLVASDGKLSSASLPAGKIAGDYGATDIPDTSDYFLMRQNPTQQKTSTVTGARVSLDDYGNPINYYTYQGDSTINYDPKLYRVVSSTQPTENDPAYYTLSTDASIYPDKPLPMDPFTKKAPDPTLTQMRKLQQPSAVEQERGGLISSEIIGRGSNPYL